MKKIRCAIYDRVSTDIQVQEGLSLDTQKELLTEYAHSHGYEIVDYYADEGLTARKKLKNRKDFQRLLQDIRQDKVDLVLVTKLDRWFRNVRDYHNTQAVLEAHHCSWRTILEDYDTTTADGQLKINIMLAVAQNESDRTSERIKVVFEHKRRNGEHIAGRPAFGYMIKEKRPVKNPENAHIVDDFFGYYLTTFSKRKTMAYIQQKYKAAAPSFQIMDHMTKKEIYCGRRETDTHYCEPYITPEQFELIQTVCSSKAYPHASNERYVFSQLMKCPYCNSSMTGYIKKHTCKGGTIARYKRYRCSNKFQKHETGICLSESVAEAYMLEHICPELNSILWKFVTVSEVELQEPDQECEIKAEMSRLTYVFQKGRITNHYYETQYTALENRLREVLSGRDDTLEQDIPVQTSFSGTWLDAYHRLDPEHKNMFWKQTIRQINLDPVTHKICGFSFLSMGAAADTKQLNSNPVQPAWKKKAKAT